MEGGCYGFENRIFTPKPLYQDDILMRIHMLPKTDDGKKRIEKYLLENANPEVTDIPSVKKEEKEKKEIPKNDDYNEYDYSDDKEIDDKNW